MRKFLKQSLSLVLTLAMLISVIALSYSVSALTAQEKTISLSETDATGNFTKIMTAIESADTTHLTTITVENAGVYPIDSGGGSAIRMHSNTVLDLNGSTLVRSGSMENLFQNEDFAGNRADTTGYTMTYNFTIKNGTLDGSGGSSSAVNLANFGHASNITIDNVTFKTCRSHLIEFSGCKDVSVSNCTFTDYTGTISASEPKEAVQIDICGGTEWNGVYVADSSNPTVCQNITVDNCKFQDYPAGVGNHHTVVGLHSSNISITNNTFTNSVAYSTLQKAIWCYGFDNSTVQGNTISGKYASGIYVSGGSVDVISNTLSNLTYEPLYITKSSSYNSADSTATTDEVVTAGTVKNNTLTAKGEIVALSVFDGSNITEISGNTIKSTGSDALSASSKSNTTTIATIKNNIINSDTSYAIHVAKGTKITTISGNTITAKDNAINITSGAVVTNINNNTNISSTEASAIYVTGSGSTATNIKSNTKISSAGSKGAVCVASSAKSTTISGNTISGTYYGIRVTSASLITNVSSNTITSASGDGILITGDGTKITNITSNTIKSCATNGIEVTSTAIVSKIQYNTISSCKNYGVWIKNSGITVSMGQNIYSSNTTANEKISATQKAIDASGLAAPTLGSATNTCSGVKVTWSAVKFADKYRVFYKTSASGTWAKLADTTSTSYVHAGAASGKTYYYTVRPLNNSGTYAGSYNSTGISTTFVAAPKPTADNVNGGVKISWPASKGAAKYRVFIKNSSGGWAKLADTTASSYTYKSVTAGKSYTFTVRCINSAGSYCSSFYSGGATIKYIAAPKISSLTNSSKGVVIKWGACTGAAKYRIFYKTSASGSWTKLADTTSTSYTHTAAKKGTTYYYTVRCISSDAKSYTSGYNTTGSSIKCVR